MVTADPVGELSAKSLRPQWSLVARIGFRFTVVYLGLYCAADQILGSLINIPNVDLPNLDSLWPINPMTHWAAAHVFGIKQALVDSGSGSGDKTFDWVLVFCFLTIAAAATLVWSVLDRRRANYTGLAKWFRLLLRFALAGQMMTYGLVKLFPMQMPFPYLTRLLEPFGNFSPMGVLWAFIGASPVYEMICGGGSCYVEFCLSFRERRFWARC